MSREVKTTLAELEIRTRGQSELDLMRQTLNQTGSAADAAARDFETLRKAQEIAAGATVTQAQKLRELDREWLALERGIAGSTAAMDRFNRLSSQADKALAGGRITADQHAKALEALRSRYLAAAEAGEQAGRRMASSNDNAARSIHTLRNAAGQLSFQIQDVAVQLAGGQNALLVFAQQGSQVAGAFGPMGAAIGAAIAVAGGLAMAFGGLNSEERRATEAAEAHRATQDALSASLGHVAQSVDDLAARYRNLNSEMRRVEEAALLQATRRQDEELSKLRATVPDQLTGLRDSRAWRDAEYERRLNDLGPPSGAAAARVDEINRVTAEIEKFEKGGSIPALVAGMLDIAAAGGPMATALREAAGGLADDAKKANDLAEASRKTAALMGMLKGDTAAATGALNNFGDSAGRAASGMERLSVASERARAGASIFIDEAKIREEIAALNAGEKALEDFRNKQGERDVWNKTYNSAIKAGESPLDATAEANRLSRLERERQAAARSQAERATHAHSLDGINARLSAERESVAMAERLADARSGLAAVDRAAIEAQARYAELLRSGATDTQAAEGAALSYRKSIAGINEELAAMAERQRRDVDNTRLEFDLLGASNAERAKAVAMANAEYELRQRGVDLAKDEARTFVEQAGEIARTKALIEEQAALAGDLGKTVAGAFEDAILSGGKGALKALAEDVERIFIRSTITKPLETMITGELTKMLSPPSLAHDNDNTPASAGDGSYVDQVLKEQGALPVVLVNPAASGGGGGAATVATSAFNSTVTNARANSRVTDFDEALVAAGLANGIDPATLYGLMMTESSGNPNAVGPVTSGGWRARGLMQFSPDTAKRFGIDPTDPEQSIWAAAEYLSDLKSRRGSINGALAGYGGFVTKDPSGYVAKVQGFSDQFRGGAPVVVVEPPANVNAFSRPLSPAETQRPGQSALVGSVSTLIGAISGSPSMTLSGAVMSAGGLEGVFGALGNAFGLGSPSEMFASLGSRLRQPVSGGPTAAMMQGIDDVGQLGYAAGTGTSISWGDALSGGLSLAAAGINFANGQYVSPAEDVPEELSEIFNSLIVEALK